MRFVSRLLGSLAAVAVLSGTRLAAASNDAAATRLSRAAIEQDYLATRFDDARTKLVAALSLCSAASECAPATRAFLHCDLGVIDFALERAADGRVEFAKAVAQDPTAAIDHDLSTPALESEFAAVRKEHGAQTEAQAPARRESDCPPGFPGCGDGDATEKKQDTDAAADEKDTETSEAAPRMAAPFKRDWVSLGVQVDALVLPSARNVCAGGSGYTCFAGASYYAAVPLSGADDVVNGGIRLATTRVLLGYDRALDANLTLGGRLGYAFGGGPQRPGAHAFEPVHVEGRASYWFGRDPLGRLGLRPFVTGALGIAEVDASIPADVYASASAYSAGQSQSLTAWRKTGLDFVALGFGAMFAIGPTRGIVLELRGAAMFPTSGIGGSAQLGYSIGL